jgi:hypothetical protein
VGPPIFKEALDAFYIEVMEGCAELEGQATPKYLDAIMFRVVQTSLQQNFNKQLSRFFKLRLSALISI